MTPMKKPTLPPTSSTSPPSPAPPLSPDAPRDAAIQRLKPLFLFKQWSDDDVAAVTRFARIVHRPKGDVLFHQGETCEYLYVLLSGKVQMFRVLPDGREVTLHVLSPGALVACVALFLDKSFPASARVVSRGAELAFLQGGPFLKLLAERPDLSRKIIGALASRITDLADRIESRTAESAAVRLAGWLLDQPSRPGESGGARDHADRVIRIEGSKKSVAASLGMTPETFSRSLRALAEQGVLTVSNKEIILLDTRKLQEISDE